MLSTSLRIFAILLLSVGSANAAIVCNGVVKVNNDFYLATQAGPVVHRFTMDGSPKSGPVVSQDGTKVAYMSDEAQQILSVANSQGVIGRFSPAAPSDDVNGATDIMDISWANNSLLQVRRHLGPRAAIFDHYTIPSSMVPGPTTLNPTYGRIGGSYCSIARITNYAACMDEGTVRVVNDDVYRVSGYAGKTPIQSVVIPVGATGTVPGISDLQINPTSISGGFTLKITYGGGTTSVRIPIGGLEEVVVDEVRYGLAPKLASGGVRIDVLENTYGISQEALVLARSKN
ncbi:hypothetical protein [Solimonas sp. SE-A11]|uniref:hypothetical protein n=1 Tax=Solimonas sp. SE-A11 TaxID=3054954 RepID=UPI00259D0474|nr:hypothetical protein [Solimonas sp. SE-A11]MDM4773099.1 hypothetical protein [Solimonas sp. SE-A11]